jgi:squalene synthase HpnC
LTALAGEPLSVPAPEAVMTRARTENFPVASRLLPRRARSHLLAVYGYARLVDETGDSLQGDRLTALDWLADDLERAYAGEARHPLLVRLQPTLRECRLAREPFLALIEANRLDQRRSRYQTWAQLREYCALSADPVGELVLGIFGLATPERLGLSSSICTALQLAEHCQDVAEDYAHGRVYMPQEDMERFGCEEPELAAAHAGAPLKALLGFEVRRARTLLVEGRPLLDQLHGRLRLAVAGFIAGGHAALDAIERAGYDVLAGAPRAGRAGLAVALARTLAGRDRRPQ